jgi:hypothetical protein
MMKKWLMVGIPPRAVGDKTALPVGVKARVGTGALVAAGEGLSLGTEDVGAPGEGVSGLGVALGAAVGQATADGGAVAGCQQATSASPRVNTSNGLAITHLAFSSSLFERPLV